MEENRLSNVVSDFLMEADFGDAEYTKAYHLARRGLKDLQFDLPLETVETVYLTINPDGTASLPEDCLKVLRIGLEVNGNIAALTRNKDITKRGRLNQQPHQEKPLYTPVGVVPSLYGKGQVFERSLGRGSWTNIGEYYISGNTVFLSDNVVNGDNCVVIEYKAYQDTEEDPVIHPYVQEALIAFIRWKYAINKKYQDKWDKQYFEKEWHRLKRNAKWRMKAPIKQELNQSARQHTKEGLKS